MNSRARLAVALAFVAGLMVGIGGSKSALLGRVGEKFSVIQQGSLNQPDDVRGLLTDLFKSSAGFVLTGVEDDLGRCNLMLTADGLHADYMAAKFQGHELFVPYAAIYRIEPVGAGPATVPVIYTTAHPFAKLCGD